VLRVTTSAFLESAQKEAKVILYFTQRVVFTLGIGNEQVKFDKFHGPIELIGDIDVDQEVLLFPVKLVDKDSPDPRVQKFGKDLILCIHYKTEDRLLIQKLIKPLYSKISHIFIELVPNKDYSYINDEHKAKNICLKLKGMINNFLKLRLEALNLGSSLYNLATLRMLEEKRRAVGSFLLGNIKGLDKKYLRENLGIELSKEELNAVLNDLIDMGYVIKINQENDVIYKLSDDLGVEST